jgi:large subunit ribosomal protein L10
MKKDGWREGALNRKEKEQTISELQRQIEQYKGAVLTNFRGLKVEQMNQIRQRLREEKITFHVVKNTLMKLASKGTDLEKISRYFDGPTAMAVSYGNPISLIKIILDFVKTQPALEIKIGLIEGEVVVPGEMKGLASLPSREVLFAQILGGIQMPAAQICGTIHGLFQQVLGVLEARVDQLEGSAEAAPGTNQ